MQQKDQRECFPTEGRIIRAARAAVTTKRVHGKSRRAAEQQKDQRECFPTEGKLDELHMQQKYQRGHCPSIGQISGDARAREARREIMEESDGLQACTAGSRKTSSPRQGRTRRAACVSEATKRGRDDREIQTSCMHSRVNTER